MENKISLEQATIEINSLLDAKKINDDKRATQKELIEKLISSLCSGALIKQEDNNLVQNLLFPIGKEQKITTFEYKYRCPIGIIHRACEGLKPTDSDGRIVATIAAITSQTKGIIGQLDTEDYALTQAIALLFF